MQRPILKRRPNLLALAASLLCLSLSHSAMAQANTVLSCGYNGEGEIGDNTTINRPLLTPAFTIDGIKAIACGYYHTLALDSNGTVWAWGYNQYGQIGAGDFANHLVPVAVLTGVKAISASGEHSMALKADGTVWAWGHNNFGQVGNGSTLNQPTPVLVSGLPAIKAIAAGGYHSMMLGEDSKLYVCGDNGQGQLGLGDNTNRLTPVGISTNVTEIAAGGLHSLVRLSDNTVYACGYNGYGQLGLGTTDDRNRFFQCADNARFIAAGGNTSFFIQQDGTVLATGENALGQLGMHDLTNRLQPVLVPGASKVKAIAAGGNHTLLLLANGTVQASGYSVYGQLGDGVVAQERTQFLPVKNASLISAIAAGSFSSTLLKPYTKSLATGLNQHGELGINSSPATTPQVTAPTAMNIGNSIIAVSTGPSGHHSLLLKADGTVWACGYNAFGQLGQGPANTADSITPVLVKGPNGSGFLSNIIAIAAGDFHNIALAADGTFYTWGRNSHGQLGTGDTVDRFYPVHITKYPSVCGIAAGGYHTIIQVFDGTFGTCGYNGFGQLGVGDTTDHPDFFFNSSTAFSLLAAAGDMHTLGLYYNGEIEAFGYNGFGQLALNDTNPRAVPVFEPGTQAEAIVGGGNHTLCLNSLGQVWAAGNNGAGELGLGDTFQRNTWNFVSRMPLTIGIAAGYTHSLFFDANGSPYACGYNINGQLGIGTTATVTTPSFMGGAPGVIGMAGGYGHTLILTAPHLQMASLKLSKTSVKGGSSLTGTVTLTNVAGAGGQRVFLSTDSNLFVSIPAYVDVPSGSRSASFTIKTVNPGFTLTANLYAQHYNYVSATLTLTP